MLEIFSALASYLHQSTLYTKLPAEIQSAGFTNDIGALNAERSHNCPVELISRLTFPKIRWMVPRSWRCY